MRSEKCEVAFGKNPVKADANGLAGLIFKAYTEQLNGKPTWMADDSDRPAGPGRLTIRIGKVPGPHLECVSEEGSSVAESYSCILHGGQNIQAYKCYPELTHTDQILRLVFNFDKFEVIELSADGFDILKNCSNSRAFSLKGDVRDYGDNAELTLPCVSGGNIKLKNNYDEMPLDFSEFRKHKLKTVLADETYMCEPIRGW